MSKVYEVISEYHDGDAVIRRSQCIQASSVFNVVNGMDAELSSTGQELISVSYVCNVVQVIKDE